MLWVGIDPGKRGAMAATNGKDWIAYLPIPMVKAGKTGRLEYDLVAIRDQLEEWMWGPYGPETDRCFVTVEKSQPLPLTKGGTQANFQRGVNRGWEWMLTALKIPYQLVHPKTWQRVMHAGTPEGDTKQRSILAAKRLFPGLALRRTPRSRKDDDGVAEALLLAEYGRRTYGSA